jgi:Uma2 family endonuclease
MAIARRGLTLEDFLALPEEKPALEYVDGVVTQKVAPLYEHSVLQRQLMLQLESQLAPLRLGHVCPELRVSFGGRSHVPDLTVYRRERLPRRTRGRRIGELLVAPDLAIEIISPGQSPTTLAEQCQWYVDHWVKVALLVEDRRERIRVFRPAAPPTVHLRGDTIALDEIAPALRLVLDDVFAALDDD